MTEETQREETQREETQAAPSGLHVVVTGATGNVGTAVVRALGEQDAVKSILGVARRATEWTAPKARFEAVAAGCRVTLTHGGWEALGEIAPILRREYAAGWPAVLGESYARFAAAHP